MSFVIIAGFISDSHFVKIAHSCAGFKLCGKASFVLKVEAFCGM
jgi:hypothetical protein